MLTQYMDLKDIIAITSTCRSATRMLRGACILSPPVTYRGFDKWVTRTGVSLKRSDRFTQDFYLKRAAHRTISLLCYAADGSGRLVMAVEELQRTLEMWDLHTMSCVHLFDKDMNGLSFVHALVAFPGQPRIACAFISGNAVKIWNLDTLYCEMTITFRDTNFAVALCIDTSGNLLSGSAYNGVIRMWDTCTGECIQDTMKHGENPIRAMAVLDNGLLVSLELIREAVSYNDVKVWNTRRGEAVATIPVRGYCLCICPLGGSRFAIGHGIHDHSVSIFTTSHSITESTDFVEYERTAVLHGHASSVIALLRVGDRLVSCGNDKALKVWDLGSEKCVKTIKTQARALASPVSSFFSDSSGLTYSCYMERKMSHEIHVIPIH